MSRADGVGGALRAAVAGAEAPAGEAQEELFPLATWQRPGESDEAFAKREAAVRAEHQRSRGRPAGARNLMTRELLELGLRMNGGKHPFIERMRFFGLGIPGIAAQLGCSLIEAQAIWERMGAALERFYIAPRAPVDDTGRAVPNLLIQLGGQGLNTHAGDGAKPWDIAFTTEAGETVTFQRLGEDAGTPAPADPHGSDPHGEGKP